MTLIFGRAYFGGCYLWWGSGGGLPWLPGRFVVGDCPETEGRLKRFQLVRLITLLFGPTAVMEAHYLLTRTRAAPPQMPKNTFCWTLALEFFGVQNESSWKLFNVCVWFHLLSNTILHWNFSSWLLEQTEWKWEKIGRIGLVGFFCSNRLFEAFEEASELAPEDETNLGSGCAV